MKSKWDIARENIGSINDVIELIKEGPASTRGKRGKPYILDFGKQRRASIRGEGQIENQLLNVKQCILLKNGKELNFIRFLSNAFGIGGTRLGNVIVDLFGLDKKDSPVCGEVKITSGNPWSAVVQSVEQVALLRSDRKYFLENIRGKFSQPIRGTGAWGLVIAPRKYWNKKESESAKKLVEVLREKTKVRICCTVYDEKAITDQAILEVVYGLPPYAK